MGTNTMPKYSKARNVLGLSFMDIEKALGAVAASELGRIERDLTPGEFSILKELSESKPKKSSSW